MALAAGAACLALFLAAVVVAAYVRNRRNNGQGEEGKDGGDDADAEKGEGDEEESEKEKSVGWWRSTFGFMLGSSAAAAASDVDGVKVKNAAYEVIKNIFLRLLRYFLSIIFLPERGWLRIGGARAEGVRGGPGRGRSSGKGGGGRGKG